ncbi:MAG: hypothetical protein HY22_05110 [[Candidatus Thermochlorobacteriaceae] bacterium GBChlB]|nr:MAG: hypothetical protein HY22_05110 [[Candidatus Thermochlorobacteriaceae] bacterium GBChlB]
MSTQAFSGDAIFEQTIFELSNFYAKMSKRFYLPFIALTLVSFLSGCARQTTSPDPLENTASVRTLHLSPGSPALNMRINGARLNAPGTTNPSDTIRYLDNRAYFSIPAGATTVNLVSAPTFAIPSPPQLTLTAQFQAEPNQQRYTVAVVDTIPRVSTVVYRDTVVAPTVEALPPGRVLVRVVHASPNAPAVTPVLRVISGAAPDSVRTFPSISFRQATPYIRLNAGSGTLQILNSATQAVIATPAASVPGPGAGSASAIPGFIYTIYIRGIAGNTGATALGLTVIRDN